MTITHGGGLARHGELDRAAEAASRVGFFVTHETSLGLVVVVTTPADNTHAGGESATALAGVLVSLA